MAKITKAQQKRLVRDIKSKAQRLFMTTYPVIVNTADMAAIEKLTAKWLKRIG